MSAQHTTPGDGHAPGFRAIKFNMDWITRPLFGFLLASFAIVVVASGAEAFAVVLALGALLAGREWHRCVGAQEALNKEMLVTGVTVALSEAALLYFHQFWAGAALAVAGAAAAFVLAKGKHPFWQAIGTLYLTLPALALVSLRAFPAQGFWLVVGLFIIVWSTDTGALICGNLIGGPRIAPRLSPGKTWAGTIGGSVIAALIYAAYVGYFWHADFLQSAPFAFVFSFTAHGGDLFESFVKRRFGLKNSGSVIPGHGGILDRMDSTLAAAPVMALLVFVAHFNPLFGTHA
jgi:phosphatidate cytidylyltransferase